MAPLFQVLGGTLELEEEIEKERGAGSASETGSMSDVAREIDRLREELRDQAEQYRLGQAMLPPDLRNGDVRRRAQSTPKPHTESPDIGDWMQRTERDTERSRAEYQDVHTSGEVDEDTDDEASRAVEEGDDDEDENIPITIEGTMRTHSKRGIHRRREGGDEEARPYTPPKTRSHKVYGKYEDKGDKQRSQCVGMFPIVAKSNGRDEYQPFTLGDIQALSELLPGIQEGGGVWLTSLYNKTRGKTLAMGDLRAILGFSVSDWALKELEAAAGTAQVLDRSPLNPYATSYGNAIRQKYPIPAGKLHSLVFKIKNGESGRTFIERAKTEWAGATGVNPDKESQQSLFRLALARHRLCINPSIMFLTKLPHISSPLIMKAGIEAEGEEEEAGGGGMPNQEEAVVTSAEARITGHVTVFRNNNSR
ncbi:uncharacterized protein LOC141770927 [Sebastes fasciatus]|uniref:uncharacterized protein LOC141770927 n=1 Tax=Sebastes fasciatus TaxID=394691 RepID=UPI003D9EFD24